MDKLTDNVMSSMAVAKVFCDSAEALSGMGFSDDGQLLVTSSLDDSIRIYDCYRGVLSSTLFSKKYGAANVRFTHSKSCVIYSSIKNGHSLRYLSCFDNRYLRYFDGHTDLVNDLHMCPSDDTVLSTSLDGTIRLWDLNIPKCQGIMSDPTLKKTQFSVSFDPNGIIFAIAAPSLRKVKMYDLRGYSQGPFSEFSIAPIAPIDVVDTKQVSTIQSSDIWHSLHFSGDGNRIALTSPVGVTVIDALEGKTLQLYHHDGEISSSNSASTFSPDGQYLLSGTKGIAGENGQGGQVVVFPTGITGNGGTGGKRDIAGIEHVKPLAGLEGHRNAVNMVAFNPKYLMFVSADQHDLAFWIPKPNHSQ